MSEKSHISIAAFVSENERAAVQMAASRIAQALSKAGDVPWTCDCIFSPDMDALQKESGAAMIVTSLVPEVRKSDEAWPAAEQRLRKAYAALCEAGTPVFICTVLRHVEGNEDAEALKIQIRKLNLLAAEISHESGAYVIDIDRDLAHVGARWLQTDYRLAGNTAAEMAAHFIALTLITNAVDALVSFEVQESARESVAANRPAVTKPDGTKAELLMRQDLRPMGQGRRKQTVIPVVYTERDVYAGWYLRQVLRGKIGPAQLFNRVVEFVRVHGVFGGTRVILALIFKQLQK